VINVYSEYFLTRLILQNFYHILLYNGPRSFF